MATIRKTRLVAMPGSSTPFQQEYFEDVPHTHKLDSQKSYDTCQACEIEAQEAKEKGLMYSGYDVLSVSKEDILSSTEYVWKEDQVIIEEANAEETGAGAGGGSHSEGADREAQGRLHLRDSAQDGLDASAPEGYGGDAEKPEVKPSKRKK